MSLVTLGLRGYSHTRPRHPASLPICVPSVERLPAALSRRLLAETTWRFDYGWRHYPRREPFIPIDQPPAGHTRAAPWPLQGRFRLGAAKCPEGRAPCESPRLRGALL